MLSVSGGKTGGEYLRPVPRGYAMQLQSLFPMPRQKLQKELGRPVPLCQQRAPLLPELALVPVEVDDPRQILQGGHLGKTEAVGGQYLPGRAVHPDVAALAGDGLHGRAGKDFECAQLDFVGQAGGQFVKRMQHGGKGLAGQSRQQVGMDAHLGAPPQSEQHGAGFGPVRPSAAGLVHRAVHGLDSGLQADAASRGLGQQLDILLGQQLGIDLKMPFAGGFQADGEPPDVARQGGIDIEAAVNKFDGARGEGQQAMELGTQTAPVRRLGHIEARLVAVIGGGKAVGAAEGATPESLVIDQPVPQGGPVRGAIGEGQFPQRGSGVLQFSTRQGKSAVSQMAQGSLAGAFHHIILRTQPIGGAIRVGAAEDYPAQGLQLGEFRKQRL